MSRRKPLAALAALTAALAVAVPAASASAAPTERTVSPRQFVIPPVFGPGSLYCDTVYFQLKVAGETGNILAETVLGNLFVDTGCGGAAI
jgi:hypothetical protein